MVKRIKTQNGIAKFVSNNIWNLVITLVTVSIAWATLSGRVLAVEADQADVAIRLDKIDSAIERIIKLEEHEKSIVDDVAEIKIDIKDIKKSLNLR